ncbi:MAG: S-layer homology domain-containing protein, partial [Clostridia bacterium]|nr:S-layer homology domain-containing protein [Clostridia bacterium]
NASSPRLWRETEIKNVYRFLGKVTNAGSVIFDGGKAWGIRVTRLESDDNVTINNGLVHNGISEPYLSKSRPWAGYKSLENELEFVSVDDFYLYCSLGNPGEVFDSIEISSGITGISGSSLENVVIDNIKLFAYGCHGIGVGNIKNFTVQNSIFGWIGGSLQFRDVRYGNAIQNWGNADGFVIDNCWAYQTYDCCYTTQYSSETKQDLHIKNVEFKNSLAERSNSGPEIWNGTNADGDTTYYDNVKVYNNYVRNDGYGWSHQRPSKDGNFFYGSAGSSSTEWKDFKFYNNKFFICSSVGIKTMYMSENYSHFNSNTYIIGEDKNLAQTAANMISVSGSAKLYPYNDNSVGAFKYYGVEADGEFYSVPEGYEPEPFDYKNAGDVYNTSTFADVKNHWALNDINYVTDMGYFNGISKFEFAPEASMTRAMLYAVLARLSDVKLENSNPWYASAVDFAVDNKFTSEENARPDSPVTRAELAVLAARYLKYRNAVVNDKAQSFKDNALILKSVKEGADFDADELTSAISVCVNAGIINGYDDGKFKPSINTTRAQIAAVIGRINDYLARCDYDFDSAKNDGSVVVLDSKDLDLILTDSKKSSTKTYSVDGYVRFVPVNSESGTVQIDLYQKDVDGLDFFDKKFVKFRYRLTRDADLKQEQTLDVGLRWPSEQWLSSYKRPVIKEFGEWQTGIVCYNYFTANGKTKLPYQSMDTYFYTIKPWGNNVVLSDEYYFDISDVAFFESEYMAEKYEF